MTKPDEMKDAQMGAGHPETEPRLRRLKLFGREFPLPKSRLARITIGVNLVFFGLLGFLPLLGFWMIPLGLLLLSVDIAVIRRLRRKMIVYYNGYANNGSRKRSRR